MKQTTRLGKKLSAAKIKEAADALGVNVQALASSNKIQFSESGEIDLDSSYQRFETLEEARRYREEVESNIRLVRFQRLRAELVSAKLVARAWDELMIDLQNSFKATIERITPELTALSDPKQVRDTLLKAYEETVVAMRDRWLPPEPPQTH